jgi:putative ABC transport system ATP-binding protein
VAIARALIGNPDLILADEPTGNLDSKMGAEIMELLHQLHEEGRTIVMVTHNEHQAQQTQRIIKIFDGALLDDRMNG